MNLLICSHMCAAATLLDDSKEARERITKYHARLRDVRAKREALASALKAAAGMCGLVVRLGMAVVTLVANC